MRLFADRLERCSRSPPRCGLFVAECRPQSLDVSRFRVSQNVIERFCRSSPRIAPRRDTGLRRRCGFAMRLIATGIGSPTVRPRCAVLILSPGVVGSYVRLLLVAARGQTSRQHNTEGGDSHFSFPVVEGALYRMSRTPFGASYPCRKSGANDLHSSAAARQFWSY